MIGAKVIPIRAPLLPGDVVTVGDNCIEAVIAEVDGDKARLAFFDAIGRYYREWVPMTGLRLVRR
jgi:hypothetical protein